MQSTDVSRFMGEWGKFHTLLIAIAALPMIANGYQVMMVVVILAVPLHRCRVPEIDNDTFSPQSEWHKRIVNAAIPSTLTDEGQREYDKCHMYVDRNVSLYYTNSSFRNGTGEMDVESCQGWVYDTSVFRSTFITQFDLVCEQKEFRAHINMSYMFGILIGSSIAGYICDRVGRKPCLFVAAALSSATVVLASFPVYPMVFLVCRIASGCLNITIYLSIYVLMVELVGSSKRNMASSLLAVWWVGGCFIVACLSYVLRDWNYLQLAGITTTVVLLFFWKFIPESPRWLLSRGRVEQATQIIKRVAAFNKIELPANFDELELKEPEETSKEKPSEGPLAMLKHRSLVVRILIIYFNWIMVAMAYYGLSLNVSNLKGDLQVNFLLSSTVELIGYCLAWLLLDRLGRKRTHCLTMILGGSACLITIFTMLYLSQGLQWVSTALAMVGKLGISASFSSIYLLTAEQFPTVVRNFGVGSSSTSARLGSLLSPYIADLSLYIEGAFGRALPLVIFGGLAVIAGLLSLLLPETLGRTLPDTIEEAARFGKKKSKPTVEEVEMTSDPGKQQTEPLVEND